MFVILLIQFVLYGWIVLIDINLDQFVMPQLILAYGVVAAFAIGFSFAVGDSKKFINALDRDSMTGFGYSIVKCGIISLFATIPFSLGETEANRIFCRLYIGVILISLIYSLFVAPSMLNILMFGGNGERNSAIADFDMSEKSKGGNQNGAKTDNKKKNKNNKNGQVDLDYKRQQSAVSRSSRSGAGVEIVGTNAKAPPQLVNNESVSRHSTRQHARRQDSAEHSRSHSGHSYSQRSVPSIHSTHSHSQSQSGKGGRTSGISGIGGIGGQQHNREISDYGGSPLSMPPQIDDDGRNSGLGVAMATVITGMESAAAVNAHASGNSMGMSMGMGMPKGLAAMGLGMISAPDPEPKNDSEFDHVYDTNRGLGPPTGEEEQQRTRSQTVQVRS